MPTPLSETPVVDDPDLATDEEIARAREEIDPDRVQIDDGAAASRFESGVWVAGWIRLDDD